MIIGSIPQSIVSAVQLAWPDQSWQGWHTYTGERGDKLVSKPSSRLPEAVYGALWAILERVSWPVSDCLGGSFVDLSLHAAGMHWIKPGGRLPRHLDAERHPSNPWRRTHSIVCFLDSMQDGGQLVLQDGKEVIQPVAGNVAVFETTGNWHWVTETKQNRRTLALFAYQPATESEHSERRERALFESINETRCSSRSACKAAECAAKRGTSDTCRTPANAGFD